MISNTNSKVNKGIVFAGCSFTWGQGLYYYSNLPTLKEPPPDRFDPGMLRRSHIKFMEATRYPRLVADYFNTYEYVFHDNGGSNEGIVNYWKKSFAQHICEEFHDGRIPMQNLDYSEVSCVVFQLTQWQRDTVTFTDSEGKSHTVAFHSVLSDESWNKLWTDYCNSNNIDANQWMDNFIENKVLKNVKEFLQEIEDKGIRTAIFTWPNEFVKYILKDKWLTDRFITFDYKNNNFTSIEKLMGEGVMHNRPSMNPELTIKWDEDNFNVTPKDHHPSLKCHAVMAENIIRFLGNIE
jgi:hypothetical protein